MEHPLVGRSRVRSSARASEQALSNVSIYLVRRRPRSSVFLNQMLIHSFIRPSFVRLLTTRSLRKSPFRETYKSVTKKRRKERRKRRFASKRRGEGMRERMCALLAFTESAVVQKNRITLHTIERMAANFRSSSFVSGVYFAWPRGNQRLSARFSFIHGRDSAFEGTARSSNLARSHMFQPRVPKLCTKIG